jgi:hypothetical protein
MEGILRTIGAVAFCVITVSLPGCRTEGENHKASASPAPACETTPAARQSVEGSTTAPAGIDTTKPVHEPNEFRSPSRPPIIYRPRPKILPFSAGQVEDIKAIVQKQAQREIWFILVESHGKDSHLSFYPYRVEVYTMPDCRSGRIRRGSVVYISEELRGPRIQSFSYAHVCETGEAFPPDLAPPNDLTRLPFKVFGDISDEEIVEVVQFIRSGPSVLERLTYSPDGRTRRFFIPNRVEDPPAPIQAVHKKGGVIDVQMAGTRPDILLTYGCQKVDGVWTLVHTSHGLVETLK